METRPKRFSQLRWLQYVTCIGGMIGSITLVALALMGYGSSHTVWMIAAGGFTLFLVVIITTVTPLLLKMESSLTRQLGEIRDLHDTVQKQAATLGSLEENTRISDAAKSLAHREQEVTMLQAVIREDIRMEKWDAALSLVDEMERRFGYKPEADQLREELDELRNERIQKRLDKAISVVDEHFKDHEWGRAQAEISRLLEALPNETRLLSLQDKLKAMQVQHKQELMREWEEAVKRSDTDHAIEVLRELDQYLSPAEAAALQNSARSVFKEKLLLLGVQFRFAVKERRWHDAMNTGLELIRDYPNARMTAEVREAMDTLRERARHAAENAKTSAIPPT